METPVTPPTLHRALGPAEVLFLTFSALSPAMSVFIYGDGILHIAGGGAAWAVIVGGMVAAAMALLYAELGAAFPQAGGVYPSLVGVLGPFWAFPYITMMMVLAPALVGFTLLGMADYVRVIFPGLPAIPIAIVTGLAATLLGIQRIRFGALVTGAFLALEAVAIIVLTAIALTHPARSLGQVLAHPMLLSHGALVPAAPSALALAGVSGIFACAGASWAMYFGEELKDAPRRIGRLIAWVGPLAAAVIAAPIVLMLLSARDLGAILAADAPMAAYMARTGGPLVSALVSAGLVVALFNAAVVTILGYGRLYYATGRDGFWPAPASRLLARISPRTRAPAAATWTVTLVGLAMTGLGEQRLLVLSAGENIFEYLMMAAAVLVGRRLARCGGQFRIPLHPALPVLGLLVTAGMAVAEWLDPAAGRPSLLLLAGLFVASLAYHRLVMQRRSPAATVAAGEAS